MRYDFIEIGTSDFDSLAQNLPDQSGISVEPVKAHLDNLPTRPNLKKVHAAIGERTTRSLVYFIPEKTIVEHDLPLWLKGCNSVGEFHPTALRELQKRNLPTKLIRRAPVRVITIDRLFRTNTVYGVRWLKLDCEGYDCQIIRNLVRLCNQNQHLWPEMITFEANSLTPLEQVSDTALLLEANGYKVSQDDSEVRAER